MTIEQAIEHCKEVAMYEDVIDCDSEYGSMHHHIAEWLEELVRLRGKWIKVSDRLPTREEYQKNDGRFIVTDGNRVEQGFFDIYANGVTDPYWPYNNEPEPTMWMEMPEIN